MKLVVVISIVSSLYCDSLGIDVPAGINKCVLKYPEVYKCAMDEANRLIPEIAKGSEELGIPSLSPIRIPRAELHTADFNLIATDVVFDNFKDFKLVDAYFHLDYRNVSILFQADFLNITSNYEIDDGKLLSRKIWGSGRLDVSLAGNFMRYTATITYRHANNETYFRLKDPNFDLDTKRGYFHFENLKSSEGGTELNDTQEFINENWRTLLDLLSPRLGSFIFRTLETTFDEVHDKIPLEKLFIYE